MSPDWIKVFPPDMFLKDMVSLGEIFEDEVEDIYGRVVGSLCHNSVAWMYKRILETHPHLLDHLYLVSGVFRPGGFLRDLGFDHSWVEYRNGDTKIVLDLTLAQFRITEDRLYIGDKPDKLEEFTSICFNDTTDMLSFIVSV